jgi:type II secretory pathway pseudopilin PulG
MRISNSYIKTAREGSSNETAMTLVEVVMSLLISSVALSCMVTGYVFSINAAERSALSLAATTRASERLEETRAARWDVASFPVVDQLQASNFAQNFVVLDMSGSGTNVTWATNTTSIYTVSTDPPLRGIRVDCVWRFRGQQWVTNTVETVRAPD